MYVVVVQWQILSLAVFCSAFVYQMEEWSKLHSLLDPPSSSTITTSDKNSLHKESTTQSLGMEN